MRLVYRYYGLFDALRTGIDRIYGVYVNGLPTSLAQLEYRGPLGGMWFPTQWMVGSGNAIRLRRRNEFRIINSSIGIYADLDLTTHELHAERINHSPGISDALAIAVCVTCWYDYQD
jgi:hypothetical protein